MPAYLDAVGSWVDGNTYVVGSLFFTTASYFQLVQAQSPATRDVDRASQHRPVRARLRGWLPHDRNWLAAATRFPGTLFFNISTVAALTNNATAAETDRYVWRPDLFGSMLFLVSSAYAVLAVSHRFLSVQPRSVPWRIAWLNMPGSVLFLASALQATCSRAPTSWCPRGSPSPGLCSARSASSSAHCSCSPGGAVPSSLPPSHHGA